MQQRRLADARLAADRQDRALPATRLGEDPVEEIAFARSAQETQPPVGGHPPLGLYCPKPPRPCRHLSRKASTAPGWAVPTVMPRSRRRRARSGSVASLPETLTITPP